LFNPGGAAATLSGPIQLAGDTTITGDGLTISGAIGTAASVSASATTNLTILDSPAVVGGTFTLAGVAPNTYRGSTTSQISTLQLSKVASAGGVLQAVTAIPGDLIATGGSHVVGGDSSSIAVS
jgi:hypothetical protein